MSANRPVIPPAATRGWFDHVTGPGAALLVLLVFYAALVGSLRHKSAAIDEPGHAAAGYTYWKLGDYRMDPENGNLSQRWIGLAYLGSAHAFDPANTAAWGHSHAALLGDAWFNRLGHDTATMLLRGRAWNGLLAVALGWLIWHWARSLFGATGGMLALASYVLSPTVLAHGALMTSDIMCAFLFLLSLRCAWLTLERVTLLRLLGSSAALAGLFLSKMSAVAMVVVIGALLVVRVLDRRPLRIGGTRMAASRGGKAAALAAVVLVHATLGWVLIWSAYGFRYSAFAPEVKPPAQFQNPWEWVLSKPTPAELFTGVGVSVAQVQSVASLLQAAGASSGEWSYDFHRALPRLRREVLSPQQVAEFDRLAAESPPELLPQMIDFARRRELLPEAFLYGFARVVRLSRGTNAFFNGEVRFTGWRTYFPYTFLVKTPLPFLALLGLAAWALWRHVRARDVTTYSTLSKMPVGMVAPTGQNESAQGNALGTTIKSTPSPEGETQRRHGESPLSAPFHALLPLLALIVVFAAFAIFSHINIGIRHILPLHGPLFVLVGAAGLSIDAARRQVSLLERRLGITVAALLAVLFVDVAARYPTYLGYFNGLVAPSRAHRHLVDSSLDWGLELPAVSAYLRNHQGQPAYLAYLGLSRPDYYGIRARLIGGHYGLDWKAELPLHLLKDASRADLSAFLAKNTDYDPSLILQQREGDATLTLLVKRAAALRLSAGTYLISATMLQPLYYRTPRTTWDAAQETHYQNLRTFVQPLLSDDANLRRQALGNATVEQWVQIFDDYTTYRFARLTHHLRQRTPDEQINHSVLVYHLTDADIAAALDGPLPGTPRR